MFSSIREMLLNRRRRAADVVAKTKGKPRSVGNPNARYHGGKHVQGCLPHIHEQYINEALDKRQRKNEKRAAEFGYA